VRIVQAIVAAALVALVAPRARAQSEPTDGGVREIPGEMTSWLAVGRPVAFVPAEIPASVICDDLAVLRVEDAGTYLRLTGLKPGETACSFGSLFTPGRRLVYRFIIVR
jgi:hypothetical protein